jgi:hypothetical protein
VSTSTRFFLSSVLAIMLALPQLAPAQAPQSCTISPTPPPFKAAGGEDPLHALPRPEVVRQAHTHVHNQGLYGKNTLYLSHLAVFMGEPERHPHNFQVILEVDFKDPEAKARYQADRAQNPNEIYTVNPLEPFDQGALVTGSPGSEPLRSFPHSTVFRGHLEQGGKPVISDTFAIKRVIYFQEFFLSGPKLQNQHYLLFGREGDVLLSHLLSAPPDFDQFLAVEFKVKEVPSESVGELVQSLLAQGLYLQLPDRENRDATRLRAGDVLTCSLETGTRALPITVELHTKDELYCETGDLEKLVMINFNPLRRC